ncbi:holo-[acyl-carrier-protein] synthase [Candidatus Dependentiae bacterium]|nr:holo-[acyl-carrier-protein] synthase [Candidatus Dependentiae bacterium]
MILGIGTDIVKVDRFNSWLTLGKDKFLRIFSQKELDLCYKNDKLDIQSLAARFAAKEAFYKALSSALIKLNLNKNEFFFLFSCKNIEVLKSEWGVPIFKINWPAFEKKLGTKIPQLNVDLAISHEKDLAIAFVVVSS